MEQDEMSMYQCPYCNGNVNPNGEEYDDDDFRFKPWHGPIPYGYGYPNPYFYGWGHHGYHGHHRDYEEDIRHDYQPMPAPMPAPVPIQHKLEKNLKEFIPLEQKMNITQINNTVVKIEKEHPCMMRRLLLLGIAEAECRKIIYLALLCCEKFELD